MSPFEKIELSEKSHKEVQALAKALKVSLAEVKRICKEHQPAAVFQNDTYLVHVRVYTQDQLEFKGQFPHVLHLSIRRLDRQALHDWRELQGIKNEILGEEIEMWECYPKESLLVDTANQYHLFGFDSKEKIIPFGFTSGRTVLDKSEELEKLTSVKQRKIGSSS